MSNIIELKEDFIPSKDNISGIAGSIVERLNSGEADPLKVIVQLTAVEKACAIAREQANEIVLTELSKYGKSTSVLGAKIEQKEVGVKWDYSQSEAWIKLKEQKDKIDEKIKAVENIAKTLPEGAESSFTDTDTGETWGICKGLKSSKTSFAVTLQK